jgi:hypothetical protein
LLQVQKEGLELNITRAERRDMRINAIEDPMQVEKLSTLSMISHSTQCTFRTHNRLDTRHLQVVDATASLQSGTEITRSESGSTLAIRQVSPHLTSIALVVR